MSRNEKTCITMFWIGLLIIFSISVWLGFPSPYYNRTAIAIVGYMFGALLCITAFGCTYYDDTKGDE